MPGDAPIGLLLLSARLGASNDPITEVIEIILDPMRQMCYICPKMCTTINNLRNKQLSVDFAVGIP